MLTTLKSIIQEVSRIPRLSDALDVVSDRIKTALQVDSCTLYLADHLQQQFVLVATQGLSPDAVGNVHIGFSEGLIGLIGQREEPLNIEDAQSHPRFKQYPEVKEERYHAFLGVPIIHQRKVLGVITLQQQHKRRFSEDEEAFLVTVSVQLALEVANAEARGQLLLGDDDKLQQRSLAGVPGSAGLAMGKAYVPQSKRDLLQQLPRRTRNIEQEIRWYREAVKLTRVQVQALSDNLLGTVPEDVRAIFQLYDHLLDANSLGIAVEAEVKQGWTAITGLKTVVEGYVNQFRNMQDAYLQERAVDVEDLANRVMSNLMALKQNQPTATERQPQSNTKVILVAEQVSASMLASISADQLQGVISIRGSANSHAAILARGMGLPAVMGLSGVSPNWLMGQQILLDGYSGEVVVSPSGNVSDEFQLLVEEEQELFDLIAAQQDAVAQTHDQQPISLYINGGLAAEMEAPHQVSGEGVGLYRTEVPFMLRERFPSEQEQYLLYRQLLENYATQQVTMRTLDVGGDKPLPYFPINEENPFLGWRGVRLTLDHPEIFLVQVRAMLRASIGIDNLQIMLPMITSLSEVNECQRLLRQAIYEVAEEAKAEGKQLQAPQIGVMLEVPGILYQLPQLAQKVDFFSVGSNDLTQYLLAVDRNNARVAELYDSYHPSVLQALLQIVQQADRLQVPVTLCGELAGEPGGLLLLLGMGYRRLSMNSHNLLKAKWVLRNVKIAECERLLHSVLSMEHPQQIREEVNYFLECAGLGGLVRAGI